MKTVVMNYREPKVLNKKVENGKLRLTLDWYQLGKGESIISKTPYGYNYEDVGYMKRSFTEIDTMMWEFELPQFLKIDIENLPLLNEDKNKPELTNTGEIELSKQSKIMINKINNENLVNNSNQTNRKIGRNEKCICGSGKKYKKCCLRKESKVIQLKNENNSRVKIGGFDFFFKNNPTSTQINVCEKVITDLFNKTMVTKVGINDVSPIGGNGTGFVITMMFDEEIEYSSREEYYNQVQLKMYSVNESLMSQFGFDGYTGWEVYLKTSMDTLNQLTSFLRNVS